MLTKVEKLQHSNQRLQKEKKILEDEFGKKRAIFRELYVVREGRIIRLTTHFFGLRRNVICSFAYKCDTVRMVNTF